MCPSKLAMAFCVCLILTSYSQEILPELAKPQAYYKAKAEKLETQKKAAIAKAVKSYLAALDAEEKKALGAAAVDVVEAVAKEREAVLSGNIADEFPEKIPEGMRIKNARKNALLSLKRVNADFSKQCRELDGNYLKYLSKLQAKHASNDELVKQIIAERVAVMKLIAESKAADKKDVVKEEKKVARGKNVVVNGDFEEVEDGWPVGWRKPYHSELFSILEENGNKFFRINQRPKNKDGTANYHVLCSENQIMIPPKAESVELSIKMRTVDVDEKAAKDHLRKCWPYARVNFYDKDGDEVYGFLEVFWEKKNGKWRSLKKGKKIPAGAVSVKLALSNSHAIGITDFDDVEVSFK